MDLSVANEYIESFAQVLGKAPEQRPQGPLKVGVDLGTANICIAVLDAENRPVTGEITPARVVRDGLVVDYLGAVEIVRRMKTGIESRLGVELTQASAAVPPGTVGKNASAVVNVVQAADMEVAHVVDEPTAAAAALGITDGAVVDVGGGTTGVSILRGGEVIAVHDEPTGGTHMTLVLAGGYGISTEEAERIKLDPARQREVFPAIRPVAERMGGIAAGFLRGFDVECVYVVGGASSFDGFEDVIAKECGVPAYKPCHGLLVTPLGIAMLSEAFETEKRVRI